MLCLLRPQKGTTGLLACGWCKDTRPDNEREVDELWGRRIGSAAAMLTQGRVPSLGKDLRRDGLVDGQGRSCLVIASGHRNSQ